MTDRGSDCYCCGWFTVILLDVLSDARKELLNCIHSSGGHVRDGRRGRYYCMCNGAAYLQSVFMQQVAQDHAGYTKCWKSLLKGQQLYTLVDIHCSTGFSRHIIMATMMMIIKIIKTPWSESASELYRLSDRHLSAKWLPTFADRRCHVVSVTDPYGRILGFLDRSRYFSVK
jgi:hypothetical protein